MSDKSNSSASTAEKLKKFSDFDASSPVAEKLASGKLGFDPDELRAKYNTERDRRVRLEGAGQYQEMSGDLDVFENDPFVEPGFTRDPIEKEVDVAVIGGGFGGLLAGANLRKAGVKDICFIEKGGDFGGTWYWNRYPGAQCDVESYIYLPLLEQLDYMPKEKYSFGPEILDHSLAIARKYDLYDDTLFRTGVTAMDWDEASQRWHISTDMGDTIKARFVPMATGVLAKPKLPNISGITEFKGHVFHTSRWDFGYTGGDTMGNLTGLKDKRVGIVGTGPTALQCIPHLGEWAKELYVFQRTPSAIGIRGNRPTNPKWVESLEPGWQRRRLQNFNILAGGGEQDEDLVGDGWTDLFASLIGVTGDAAQAGENISEEEVAALLELSDFQKMEKIRERVDAIVVDQETAAKLKAYYRPFCKRPCFHDNYLKTFNRQNVTLVDTNGRGVDQISEKGIVVEGKEYELDCLIIATGFENNTSFTSQSGYDITGRNDTKLSDKWANGPSTMHGLFSHDFPNCFFMGMFQTGLTVSIPHMLNEQAGQIAYVIDHCLDSDARVAEVSQEAEDEWGATIRRLAHNNEEFFASCTPGYYNNEGAEGLNGNNFFTDLYGAGPEAFFQVLSDWRDEGKLQGLEIK